MPSCGCCVRTACPTWEWTPASAPTRWATSCWRNSREPAPRASDPAAAPPPSRCERRSAPLPADLDSRLRADRFAQQPDQMLGRPAVREQVDGGEVDVVVAVLGGFLLESVNEHLQVGFGDRADQLLAAFVEVI